MSTGANQIVEVFPISKGAFGLPADWFDVYAPKLIQPSFLLMVLLLMISIGILALKRFEHALLEKRLWNIPIIIVIVSFWPHIILSTKNLVDIFNTFLIRDIFQIEWSGFGFPEVDLGSSILEFLIRGLPNLAYWIIYAFYMIYFFFFAVLGPFVLAKGILSDEIENFLDVIKEIAVLFLWQTTLAILVAIIAPDIVSGKASSSYIKASVYFMSLVLSVMIFFVPRITQKFAGHLSASMFPPTVRALGAIFGISLSSRALASVGIPVVPHKWEALTHNTLMVREFAKSTRHQHEVTTLEEEKKLFERKLETVIEEASDHGSEPSHTDGHPPKNNGEHHKKHEAKGGGEGPQSNFVKLAKKAKEDLKRSPNHDGKDHE